jgi:tetratricopeptide (TPR) repeat protein
VNGALRANGGGNVVLFESNRGPMQNTRLLKQAGQFISLGKFGLALEQYLKIHQLDPQDTTIINTIGDLNLRLGKESEAILWFQKLARILESRGLPAQTAAIYKKILKLSPQNQAVMTRLAQLFEQQGQTANAKAQYALIADQLVSSGKCEQAIILFQRICRLDPGCSANWLQLARSLERSFAMEEASQAYLQCLELVFKRGEPAAASPVLEDLVRLKVRNKEFPKSFFSVLCKANLTDRGVEYLQSIALDTDPEIKAMLGEALLEEGKADLAREYLLANRTVDPRTYPVCLKLLEVLIARKDVSMSLTVVEALFETSLQLHDEITLKTMLDSLLECDESNLRVLKLLATLLVRMGQGREIEQYSKRFVILQLQNGNLSDAHDELKKMAGYGHGSLYLDLFNRLNEAMISGSNVKEISETVVRALKTGIFTVPGTSETGCALGVSEADLGTEWAMET